METSAPSRIRTCKDCGVTGPEGRNKESVFYSGQGNKCRRCVGEYDAARRIRIQNEGGVLHERRKEAMRIAQAKRLYGLTADEARTMYAQPHCEICGGTAEAAGAQSRRLNIDHDYETGRARGVLCNRCNRGLGFYLDNPELLEKAAAYLRACR